VVWRDAGIKDKGEVGTGSWDRSGSHGLSEIPVEKEKSEKGKVKSEK
jgi:hypothetical protein